MATTKVIDIIRRVEHVLQDAGVHWPRVELQDWLNEAYLTLLLARADANTVIAEFTCAEGVSRQSLDAQFPDALRILDVIRNTAAGSTGRAVRLVPRSTLDSQQYNWYVTAPVIDAQLWVFDPRRPREFMVFPPAGVSPNITKVEVMYSARVANHTLTESALDPAGATAETIRLDDVYAPVLVDWVLYRAFSKDSKYGASSARAALHVQAFSTALGIKANAETAASPVE